uniref:ATP synthase subunit n=1 Tax=Caenorhabditis japonica TaxID=281687 RepID=A0A8R1HME8_CAEJA
MATPKLGFFEKIANLSGALYRHQAAQFPRRLAVLKAVGKHELAPPRQADWPAIKADWAKVQNFIQTGAYKNLSVREGLVYTAVTLEVVFWFFVGEMIGRRYIFGYLVPSDFVSSSTKKIVKEQEALAALEA